MAAIKMEDLERLERNYGLSDDGLSYQHRCSRITAVLKGEEWVKPEPKKPTVDDKPTVEKKSVPTGKKGPNGETISRIKQHPLYGKTLLVTPIMYPDKNRNLAFDEPLGPELIVEDFQAGKAIYDQPESTDRMFGDYNIITKDETKRVVAKTTFPKIGTEITFRIGFDLVPVVRGNKGERGYVWSFPTTTVQVEDSYIQLIGLKTLIQQTFPELLPKFSGKPMMSYVDGVTLAANIPMTTALLKEQAEKEFTRERAGLSL